MMKNILKNTLCDSIIYGGLKEEFSFLGSKKKKEGVGQMLEYVRRHNNVDFIKKELAKVYL